ncbi:HlyD family secretion protein [Verrucomicrobium spinosum]|uniref:HlyD family secretion protein n=1 Tax=Verrucomicrobium spinosum TaxID=2736 RepID=UPI0001745BC3|nr:HlyD family efflux transporter periplasmic adaptor subunit [Verrucomicrobium spinosum]
MKTLLPMLLATSLALPACTRSDPNLLNGYVEADYVRVAAPVAGRLVKRDVMRGDEITAGAPLFSLNTDDELAARDEAAAKVATAEARLADLLKGDRTEELVAKDASLRQAQAALDLSTAELKRVEPLVRSKALAAADLDQARSNEHRDRARVAELSAQIVVAKLGGRPDAIGAAQSEVKAARDQLAGAEWRLKEKSQTAPAAARVEDTLYEAGEWIPAGTPVVTLLPPANVKIRFYVPETQLARLTKGASVAIHMDGSAPVQATISFISNQAEYTPPVIYSRETREKLVFLCEARPQAADAPRLHPGQPVEVHLP